MVTKRGATFVLVLSTLAWITASMPTATAQQSPSDSLRFRVSGPTQKLEMIVNTSRILTVDHDVPRLLVQNTEVVQATPLSANQIQISALRPGVTAINLWDDKENVHVVDVQVMGDVRELQENLSVLFPEAQLNVRPLTSSLVLTGFVPRPDMVNHIVRVAEDYYPSVINQMSVGGAHTVVLHVKLFEVSRTKLREFGFDWSLLTGDDSIIQSAAGILTAAGTPTGLDTLRFTIVDGTTTFRGFLDALREYNLAKLLSEPTLVATSGRPASFNSGGEIPVPISNGLQGNTVEYREFGTTVDFVPIVLGNGMIRLEVRPQVTEVDQALAVNGVPGFRSRRVDTGVEMRAGQTLVLAGLVQNRTDSSNRGLPWAADLPWVGAAFRRVEHRANEVELLIMVTPQLVSPMDPHEVPPCAPGQLTTSPNDCDLYFRGYLEVPRCDGCGPIGPVGPAPLYHDVQPLGGQAPMQAAPPEPPMSDAGFQSAPNGPMSNRNDVGPFAPVSSPPAARQSAPMAPSPRPRSVLPPTMPERVGTPHNPIVPNNPSAERGEIPSAANDPQPALIGPIGYDVLN